jgi:hypothetical protein
MFASERNGCNQPSFFASHVISAVSVSFSTQASTICGERIKRRYAIAQAHAGESGMAIDLAVVPISTSTCAGDGAETGTRVLTCAVVRLHTIRSGRE